MSDLQERADFIESCYRILTVNGCLVLNLHTDPQAELTLMCRLQNNFNHIWVCNVIDGNWILFCNKRQYPIGRATLDLRVHTLIEHVKMPLMVHYRNLNLVS